MRKKLYAAFIIPIVLAVVRLLLAIIVFVGLISTKLNWIQIWHIIAIPVYLFVYLKLFKDIIPILGFVLPDLLTVFLLLFVLKVSVPFSVILLIVFDIVSMVAFFVKASYFPYYIEGTEDKDIL